MQNQNDIHGQIMTAKEGGREISVVIVFNFKGMVSVLDLFAAININVLNADRLHMAVRLVQEQIINIYSKSFLCPYVPADTLT